MMDGPTTERPCQWGYRFTKRWKHPRPDTPIPMSPSLSSRSLSRSSSSASSNGAGNLSTTVRRAHKELAAKSRRFVVNSLSFSVPRRKRDRRRDYTERRRRAYSTASGSSNHSVTSSRGLSICNDSVDPLAQQQALYALDRQLQPYNECLVARLRFLEALPLSERSRWTETFRESDRNGAAAVTWNTSVDTRFGNSISMDIGHDDGLSSLMNAFTTRCSVESTTPQTTTTTTHHRRHHHHHHRHSPVATSTSMPLSATAELTSSLSALSLDALPCSYLYSPFSDHEYDGDGDGDGEEEIEICLAESNHY
ncbi:hypothetical protein BDF19DRAFT_420076 [Syncephalis fuscata]|nr:hypothetical protein BDF19DRAFT_420076 [Syncephalis fuscata]